MTTTFTKDDFNEPRVPAYFQNEAVNFDIGRRSATQQNFGKGLADPQGVSIYFGHSNTTDGLLFNTGGSTSFKPFADFSNDNSIVCLAACNTAEIMKAATVRRGQALVGVTSNRGGLVTAGDLSYISTQMIAGLKGGKTVGQIVDYLNGYFATRFKRNPKADNVRLVIRGDRDVSQ